MRIPENLYLETLPLLKKIERIRKPYLFFRTIIIFSILSWITPFVVFIIVSSILNIFWNNRNDLFYIQQFTNLNQYFNNPAVGSIFIALIYLPFILGIPVTILNFLIEKLRTKIIKQAVKAINPELVFSENAINREEIIDSKLISEAKKDDKSGFIISKGLIEGEIDGIHVEFSDITAYTGKNKFFLFLPGLNFVYIFFQYLKMLFSKRKDQYLVGFRGLFFMADFNKILKGQTFVLPDKFEKKIGFLAKIIQNFQKNKGALVYLEDPQFEKEFVVYSTDQIEARYVLSLGMMQKILELKNTIQRPLLISFRKTKMYLVILDNEGIFEITLTKKATKPETLEKLYTDIKLCTEITKKLKLNTKLWS